MEFCATGVGRADAEHRTGPNVSSSPAPRHSVRVKTPGVWAPVMENTNFVCPSLELLYGWQPFPVEVWKPWVNQKSFQGSAQLEQQTQVSEDATPRANSHKLSCVRGSLLTSWVIYSENISSPNSFLCSVLCLSLRETSAMYTEADPGLGHEIASILGRNQFKLHEKPGKQTTCSKSETFGAA